MTHARRWTDDEIAKLSDLLERLPTHHATDCFIEWQAKHPDRDGHDRTWAQIYLRAVNIRQTVKCVEPMSLREWGRRLGINYQRILRTVPADRRGQLSQLPLSRSELRGIVQRRPSILVGCDWSQARLTLGKDFVNALDIPSVTPTDKISVRNLSTGEVFDSFAAAGRKHFVSPQAISLAIARGGTCVGCRWERMS